MVAEESVDERGGLAEEEREQDAPDVLQHVHLVFPHTAVPKAVNDLFNILPQVIF